MAKKRLIFPLFFIFLLVSNLYGALDNKKGKIEITANQLDSTKTTVTAKDNVLVYYNDSVITASSAHYNKETKILVLDGKIELIGYMGTKEHSTHMVIHTDTQEVIFQKLFLATKHDIWMLSDSVHKVDGNYTLGQSVLSSCDGENPLWKMVSTDSVYDSQDEYMKVYNAKIYFANVPILYTPYLGFSTNQKRSSGLLFPAFGYSEEDGYFYEQPIYWAISDSMDLELNAHIRTEKTKGLYGTFRFADSPYSFGQLRAGFFEDNPSYTEENNLPNKEHYGIEFNYQSSKLLSRWLPDNYTDGLYINTTYLNDIEYLLMQQSGLAHFGLLPLQESRINYFLGNDDFYFGVNAKYFIDTTKEDNNNTIQILPAMQIHKYLDSIIWDNLTYSVDIQSKNFTREEGSTLKQYEFRVPIEFTMSLFDDYIDISLREEIYYSKFYFGNETYIEDEFSYFSNIHQAKISTDLTKKYSSFVHVLQPSVRYMKAGEEEHKPIDFDLLEDSQKELFSISHIEEQFNISLGQYFYDNNAKLIFYQRVKQDYYRDRNLSRRFSDIGNEMKLNLGSWSFYNNIVYSHEFEKIRESSSRVSLSKPSYSIGLGHLYRELSADLSKSTPSKDITFSFRYKFNERFNINLSGMYDVDEDMATQWLMGMHYGIDCWRVDASLKKEIVPRPAGSTLPDSTNKFFIQFTFSPFGSFGTTPL